MSLQIHITAGSRNGQRLLATSAPLSFGREVDNPLVIDLPQVSRKHGELVPQPDGAWVLVNHSPNGTLLGGKKVTTKPRVITGEMDVQVGGLTIFRVVATPVGTPAEPLPAAPSSGEAKKSGIKLWAGIVVGIFSALIVAMIVVDAAKDKQDAPAAAGIASELWGDARILTVVQAPPAAFAVPDDALYEANLSRGHALYTTDKPMQKDAWFEAYRAYRATLRCNNLKFKDPGDSHDYQVITAKVAGLMQEDYQEACLELNRQNYKAANPLFAKIRDYAGGADPLFGGEFRDHIQKLKSICATRLKK